MNSNRVGLQVELKVTLTYLGLSCLEIQPADDNGTRTQPMSLVVIKLLGYIRVESIYDKRTLLKGESDSVCPHNYINIQKK